MPKRFPETAQQLKKAKGADGMEKNIHACFVILFFKLLMQKEGSRRIRKTILICRRISQGMRCRDERESCRESKSIMTGCRPMHPDPQENEPTRREPISLFSFSCSPESSSPVEDESWPLTSSSPSCLFHSSLSAACSHDLHDNGAQSRDAGVGGQGEEERKILPVSGPFSN